MSHRTGHLLKASLMPGLAIVAAFIFMGCGKIGDPVPRDMSAPPAMTGPTAAAESQAAGSGTCGEEATPAE